VEGHQLGQCHGYREIFFEVVENLPVGILSFSVSINWKSGLLNGIEITINGPERGLKFVCQFYTGNAFLS
jgi:hypothetical protein